MSFFGRIKREINRLITLDLHSYWEVFYLDLLLLIFAFVVSLPIGIFMDLVGVTNAYAHFIVEYIAMPVEENIVKPIAPSNLDKDTYQDITTCLILFIEMALVHLLLCGLYRSRKMARSLQITISSDETGKEDLVLPQFTPKKNVDDDEKVSLWLQFKNEVKRLFRLDLTSCWEVFYLDAIYVTSAFLLSIPLFFLVRFFRIEKEVITPFIQYIENPVEEHLIRAVAPSDLTDYSYNVITLCTIIVVDIALFHILCCLGYLYGRKKGAKSIEKNGSSGCFSRVKVVPNEEKNKPLQKVDESVYSLSSSALFPKGSTEKVLEKAALP